MSGFEPIGSDVKWRGAIVTAGVEHFRHADGAVVARDKVWHPGAVGILAVDDPHVWLTRQPRETAGMTASLEIPAGKLDVPGEAPMACAQRELVEEIGKAARPLGGARGVLHQPGVQRRARVAVSGHASCATPQRAPSPTRTSGSRSSPGRWTTSMRRLPSPRTQRR